MSTRFKVCFVCAGNICRSPTAEAIFRDMVDAAGLTETVAVDSAGTGRWHVGETADPRARAEAARRGVEVTSIARQLESEDLDEFDLLLVMDSANRVDVMRLARHDRHRAKVRLLREFDATAETDLEVPDPYYGDGGFGHVFDLCRAACEGLLGEVRSRLVDQDGD